jgi:hypothetical protein
VVRSRPLLVLLLLACSVPAVPAEPRSALGIGWTNCRLLYRPQHCPSGGDKNLAVAGTMSSDALQAMLVDECRAGEKAFQKEAPALHSQLYLAAEQLYETLKREGPAEVIDEATYPRALYLRRLRVLLWVFHLRRNAGRWW